MDSVDDWQLDDAEQNILFGVVSVANEQPNTPPQYILPLVAVVVNVLV